MRVVGQWCTSWTTRAKLGLCLSVKLNLELKYLLGLTITITKTSDECLLQVFNIEVSCLSATLRQLEKINLYDNKLGLPVYVSYIRGSMVP